jgi:putative protease
MPACGCLKLRAVARGPEYVRVVTSCYKEAVQAYCNDTYTEEKINDWNERLSTVFNRDSGMDIISDNDWESGHTVTDRVLQNGKCYVGKAIKHLVNLAYGVSGGKPNR